MDPFQIRNGTAVPNLSIKDVPEELLLRLRERAARHHRSLQGELMALISEAVAADRRTGTSEAAEAPALPMPAAVAPAGPSGRPGGGARKSVEQIAAEHLARFPRPLEAGPSAVEIVRAERDAR